MDAAEYKHVVLGLIFLKYISDAFEEIRKTGYVLMLGRYVVAEVQEDGELFEEKMQRLTAKLTEQFRESAKLEAEIRANLKGLGYEV